MASKTKTVDLHYVCMAAARELVRKHTEEYDGEKSFNLFTFLDALEYRLEGVLNSEDCPNGRFRLNAHEAARYVWCCLATWEGEDPTGTTFRGMPILD